MLILRISQLRLTFENITREFPEYIVATTSGVHMLYAIIVVQEEARISKWDPPISLLLI
jgi:hypothetical protein